MGPLSLGLQQLNVGSNNPALGIPTDTGFLLWTAGAGNYLTINAAGDKIYINLI